MYSIKEYKLDVGSVFISTDGEGQNDEVLFGVRNESVFKEPTWIIFDSMQAISEYVVAGKTPELYCTIEETDLLEILEGKEQVFTALKSKPLSQYLEFDLNSQDLELDEFQNPIIGGDTGTDADFLTKEED